MEHHVDSLIAGFITLCGNVFIAPQFNIVFDKENKDGGSCPDYVALDFRTKEVVVIESTTASSMDVLFSRVNERETRWFEPLRRFFEDKPVKISKEDGWKIRFLCFARKDNVDAANLRYASEKNPDEVWFFPIENSLLSYAYWDDRVKKGLPRRGVW